MSFVVNIVDELANVIPQIQPIAEVFEMKLKVGFDIDEDNSFTLGGAPKLGMQFKTNTFSLVPTAKATDYVQTELYSIKLGTLDMTPMKAKFAYTPPS